MVEGKAPEGLGSKTCTTLLELQPTIKASPRASPGSGSGRTGELHSPVGGESGMGWLLVSGCGITVLGSSRTVSSGVD